MSFYQLENGVLKITYEGYVAIRTGMLDFFTVPTGTKQISNGTAVDLKPIHAVSFPDDVTVFNSNPLPYCDQLEEVSFGMDTEYINPSLFKKWPNLKKIEIRPGGNSIYAVVDRKLIDTQENKVVFDLNALLSGSSGT